MFYNNLLAQDTWLSELQTLNRSKETLVADKALFDEVYTAYETQKKEMGEAQKATEDRDQAIDALDAWYNRFMKVARLAMSDNSQLLEMLGEIETSE